VKASPLEIYNNLLQCKGVFIGNIPLTKTKQFLNFQEYIFQLIETEESEEVEDEATVHAIKKQLSKSIKKKPKADVKMVTYRGESYKIDNWIECENCKIWRIVNKKCPPHHFTCNKIGKKCSTK
jgi:hypothetical protein